MLYSFTAIQLFSCSKSINKVKKKDPIALLHSKSHPKEEKKKEVLRHQKQPQIEVKSNEYLNDSLTYLKRKYAPLLSVQLNEITNLLLYQLIDDWMGTPYKYGGNSKTGSDCSGFAGVIYSSIFDINLARKAADIYHETNIKVKKEELKEGDLVFFDIGSRELSHVGVYLTNGKFVHASTSKGVVISDLEMDYYKKYFRCGGRIINQ